MTILIVGVLRNVLLPPPENCKAGFFFFTLLEVIAIYSIKWLLEELKKIIYFFKALFLNPYYQNHLVLEMGP